MDEYPAEYIVEVGGAAVSEAEDGMQEVCVGPVRFLRRLIRCKHCSHWHTPIAFDTTGVCDIDKKIRRLDFFCGESESKP